MATKQFHKLYPLILLTIVLSSYTVTVSQSENEYLLYSDQNGNGTNLYLTQFPNTTKQTAKSSPLWLKGDLLAWAYAPNTKSLVLQYSSNFDIYLWQLESSRLQPLFIDQNPNSLYLVQDWSPDGNALLFTLNQSDEYGKNSLVVYGLDGSVQSLTSVFSSLKFPIEQARWSPDGDYIAFNARDEQTGPSDIYQISTLCLTQETPTFCPLELFQTANNERAMVEMPDSSFVREDWTSPAWSSDSKSLAFFCGDDICTALRDGTDLKRISASRGNNLSWGLNDKYLTHDDSGEIYVVDLQKEETKNVTNTPTIREHLPVWVDLQPNDFIAR
ncbi:MAG: hypothetical protein ABI690_07015 [Chloroflexota bacterium]